MLSVVEALAVCVALALVLFLSDDRRRRVVPSRPSTRVGSAPSLPAPPARRFAAAAGRAAVATMAVEAPAQLREPALTNPPVPALEVLRLEAWRRDQLVAAGIRPRDARRAAAAGIDAARVRSLVERGCPPGLALRIVA